MKRVSPWSLLLTPVVVLVALTRFAACVGDDAPSGGGTGTLPDGASCSLGSEGCGCTTGGACDPGLTCASKTCVAIGSDAPSGGDGSSGGQDGGNEDADGGNEDAAIDTGLFEGGEDATGDSRPPS